MNRGLIMSAALALAVLGGAAKAATVDAVALLGQINNIVLNDHKGASETEGNLYVGGAFSGTHVVNGDRMPEATVGGATGSVIIGGAASGRLTSNSGAVVIGGSSSAEINTNGATGANGVTVGGANSGRIQTAQPGAISIGGANSGTLNAQPSGSVAVNTGVAPQIPAAEVKTAFQTLSTELSQLATTAGAAANAADFNSRSILAGSETFAVLNIDSTFFSGGGFSGVTTGAAQTLVVNVSGKDVTITSNWNGPNAPTVLFNFFEAETLRVDRLFRASILAAFADVRTGNDVWGTLVSHNLDQRGQVIPYDDRYPFRGTIPDSPDPVAPVPLPAAAWLLLAGVGALAAAGRRRV